jgi:hypothetical protein
MRRFHPFVVGQISGGLIVYALASLWDPSLATVLMLLPLAGALIGCLLCRWRPGFEAVWWKLLPASVFTNLATFMALGELSLQWRCLLGRGNCVAMTVAIALSMIAVCLLLPGCGLLWRWWKRRLA